MGQPDSWGVQSRGALAIAGRTGGRAVRAHCGSEILLVPLMLLRPGDSPRLTGEDKEHVARLSQTDTPLPPILVDRQSMRVIDGMHRLLAASRRGDEFIEIEFFEGTAADAFLQAVAANVKHGLPLTQAERRAAAVRIVSTHPHLSDRAIADLAGLSAGTVAKIRRCANAQGQQLHGRVGKDGRIRPVSPADGRRRAAELLTDKPGASLREVAKNAGVSPNTVRDVRKRLEREEDPATDRDSRPGRGGRMTKRAARPARPVATALLEKLMRDPSVRHNERGRGLLRLLQHNATGAEVTVGVTTTLPSHCVALVAQLARLNAQMWLDFAQELERRARTLK
ncbi:MAG TPA: streptomycin biosynthesis regulator [Streptosporangiaceae bacterium]|nr:streptomycin biosynthesis regulator [Streptosporangiaceae bacterium]